MKNIINKKYILKRISTDGESTMYFRSKIDKGIFHYVFIQNEATKLTKQEAIKLLSETKHKEKFEILEVK